jgi:hypothetical protein
MFPYQLDYRLSIINVKSMIIDNLPSLFAKCKLPRRADAKRIKQLHDGTDNA